MARTGQWKIKCNGPNWPGGLKSAGQCLCRGLVLLPSAATYVSKFQLHQSAVILAWFTVTVQPLFQNEKQVSVTSDQSHRFQSCLSQQCYGIRTTCSTTSQQSEGNILLPGELQHRRPKPTLPITWDRRESTYRLSMSELSPPLCSPPVRCCYKPVPATRQSCEATEHWQCGAWWEMSSSYQHIGTEDVYQSCDASTFESIPEVLLKVHVFTDLSPITGVHHSTPCSSLPYSPRPTHVPHPPPTTLTLKLYWWYILSAVSVWLWPFTSTSCSLGPSVPSSK